MEASNLAKLCAEIVKVNGYEDTIEVINSEIEKANLPIGKEGADVIISEWMGFYLLHEAMLSSVIYARDKWLKKDGVMAPNTATLYMCPVNMNKYIEQNLKCWDKSYGFIFTPLKERLQAKNLQQPLIKMQEQSQCLSCCEMVAHFHLKYVANEDLEKINRSLTFEVNKNGICHGFACWFDCKFEYEGDEENANTSVLLSTGPDAPATHWKQTVIMLPDGLMVSKKETLKCSFELLQDKNIPRRYIISLQMDDDDDDEGSNEDTDEVADDVEGEQVEHLVESVDDEEIKAMLLNVLKK